MLDPNDADVLHRREAAAKYQPERVRLLLAAHAPPTTVERYFYFERVREKDDLFRYVVQELFGTKPNREDKASWLGQLRLAGVFLVDLVERRITTVVVGRPANQKDLEPFVPGLIERAHAVDPENVVLIKVDVYDTGRLRKAGLPVVDERIPFPTSGRQHEFETCFASALATIGWSWPNG